MAISVVCPGCKKRFSVSEQFAGKKGPCPKCKATITIPEKAEEVVVHAPATSGPKGVTGRPVLQPIFREEMKLSPVVAAGIGAGVLVVFIIALVLRFGVEDKESFSTLLLAAGAILLAPPLVFGGYSFLRNDELEPYRGQSLWIRVGICALVYAGLWIVLPGTKFTLTLDSLEIFHLVFIVPLMFAAGAGTAFACLDLDFGNGAFHYGLYLVITVLLRLTIGLAPF
jgi:hypothetical protein